MSDDKMPRGPEHDHLGPEAAQISLGPTSLQSLPCGSAEPTLEGEDPSDTRQLRRDSGFSAPSSSGGSAEEAPEEAPEASEEAPEEAPEASEDDRDTSIRYRHNSKFFKLSQGNLVFDSPVPQKLLQRCTRRDEREHTHMRYSAATCDPDDFTKEGFTLRQKELFNPPRCTELFIVITMYNEDDDLFCRTMHSVIKNIAHLCTRHTFGEEWWKKVVVCIVSDGRKESNQRTLDVIAILGAYQVGIAKNLVNEKPVAAHIFEYTTPISVAPGHHKEIEGPEKGIKPVQIIFCLKENNKKKINSHRWFFNAFCPILQPNVCVLLDVGTQPGPTSLYHLWKVFDSDQNVGGACGEIIALKGKYGLNPLVVVQNFEYKMSNILDKPFESVFGYITVLPGAFSAYRYNALLGEPLKKYFLYDKMGGSESDADTDMFTSNIYLAEDRILCWELVSKDGRPWILRYVKSAYAVTDVPAQVPEFISQRRRWINGSFFASIHRFLQFHRRIHQPSHSCARKFWILVELVYQAFNFIFSYFALGSYYIAFMILSEAMEDPTFHIGGIQIINYILNYIYLGLLVSCFILALGNRPQCSKWSYIIAFGGFAIIAFYMIIAAALLAKAEIKNITSTPNISQNPIFMKIVLPLLTTAGIYLIASILFFEPWHMITGFIPYLLMAPSYIALLNVYAFANVHDVTWGTKGDNKISKDLGFVKLDVLTNMVEVNVPTDSDIDLKYDSALKVCQREPVKDPRERDQEQEKKDYHQAFRTRVLLTWALSNGFLVALALAGTRATNKGQATANIYMVFILSSMAGLALVRFCGATFYLLIGLVAKGQVDS